MGLPILIVAPKDDLHAVALQSVLEAKFATPVVFLDVSNIPSQSRLDFFPGANTIRLTSELSSQAFSLDEIRSVWWRRRGHFKIGSSVSDPRMRRFCISEYEAFFRGILCSAQIPIVNDPTAEARASYKPLQLREASKIGLEIPKTIMSNDPNSIRAFWEDLEGRCVYKPFTAPSWAFAETRSLDEEDFPYLDKVRHAPLIVQERIEKGKDIRVNIFGSDVFAAKVTTHVTHADLDWRVDLTAKWEPHSLPQPIIKKLQSLVQLLGLKMGCADLRQQPDGEYRFFEINPSGQFLFVEIDTGQPLLEFLAHLLLNAKTTAVPVPGAALSELAEAW